MSDFLAEKFKIRFYDFPNHATNICIRIVENPLSVEVSDAPEKLQLELIGLQYDSILRSSFNKKL